MFSKWSPINSISSFQKTEGSNIISKSYHILTNIKYTIWILWFTSLYGLHLFLHLAFYIWPWFKTLEISTEWDGNPSPFPFTLYGARRSIVGAFNKMQPEHITAVWAVSAKHNKENESNASLVRSLFASATDFILFIAFMSLFKILLTLFKGYNEPWAI